MKRALITLLLIVASFTLKAQSPQRGGFQDLQSKQIADGLNLSGERRDSFDKIYNEYVEASEKLKEQYAEDPTARGRAARELSDSDIEAQTLNSFDMSIKSIEIKRDYYKRFREVLSPQEIMQMYNIERNIRDRVVNEMFRRSPDGRR